jgi:hypothetical protein
LRLGGFDGDEVWVACECLSCEFCFELRVEARIRGVGFDSLLGVRRYLGEGCGMFLENLPIVQGVDKSEDNWTEYGYKVQRGLKNKEKTQQRFRDGGIPGEKISSKRIWRRRMIGLCDH